MERRKLFSLLTGVPSQTLAHTISVPPYSEVQTRKLLVECSDLRFKLGDVEPFFCTLAMYDLAKRQRISENFYFETHSLPTSKLLENNPLLFTKEPHLLTQAKKALFSVSSASVDVYLVLRVDRVFQEGHLESIDTYQKYDTAKGKDVTKVKTTSSKAASLIPYKIPFAWSIMQLFNNEGDLLSSETNNGFKMFYRQSSKGDVSEEAFLEMFSSRSIGSTLTKRSRQIPGECGVKVVELVEPEAIENLPNRYDPFYHPLKPFVVSKGEEKKEGVEVVREVNEFPIREVSTPHLSYFNTLYFYPEAVSFAKASNFVVVVIEVLSDDSQVPYSTGSNNNKLTVIYGRSNSKLFVEKYVSGVKHGKE